VNERDVRLTVNGEPRTTAARDLAALVEELGYGRDPRGIAVALGDRVIPRSRWSATGLAEGDAVEIVGAVQGG